MATPFQQIAPGHYMVRGTLSSQGAATSEELTLAPTLGRVVRMYVQRSSGAGTTMDPVITRDSADAVTEVVVQAIPNADRTAPETALLVDEAGALGTYYLAPGITSLWLWPVFDAGADNALSYEIHVLENWEGVPVPSTTVFRRA